MLPAESANSTCVQLLSKQYVYSLLAARTADSIRVGLSSFNVYIRAYCEAEWSNSEQTLQLLTRSAIDWGQDAAAVLSEKKAIHTNRKNSL